MRAQCIWERGTGKKSSYHPEDFYPSEDQGYQQPVLKEELR